MRNRDCETNLSDQTLKMTSSHTSETVIDSDINNFQKSVPPSLRPLSPRKDTLATERMSKDPKRFTHSTKAQLLLGQLFSHGA